MLDYSLSNEEKEDFILYYERKDDKLISHLANGDTKTDIKTLLHELNIINKMEKQVKEYDPEIMEYYEENYKNSILIRSSILPVCSLSSVYLYDEKMFSIPLYTILVLGSLSLLKKGSEYKITKNIEKDYEKHKLYLDNKKLLSSYLSYDLRPLNGYSKSILNEAKNNINNKMDTININTIRLMTFEEIKKLVDGAKQREEQDKKYILKK